MKLKIGIIALLCGVFVGSFYIGSRFVKADAQPLGSGCCSYHGGVCGCDTYNGRARCCDGSTSPSCGC